MNEKCDAMFLYYPKTRENIRFLIILHVPIPPEKPNITNAHVRPGIVAHKTYGDADS